MFFMKRKWKFIEYPQLVYCQSIRIQCFEMIHIMFKVPHLQPPCRPASIRQGCKTFIPEVCDFFKDIVFMKTWMLRIKLVFVRASDIANAHREGVEQLKSYFGKVSNCQFNKTPRLGLTKIKRRLFIFVAGANSVAAFWYCSCQNRSDNLKFFHQRAEQTLHLSMDMTASKTWWKRKNKSPWSGVI